MPTTDNAIGMVSESIPLNEGQELAFSGWVEEDGTGITRRIEDGRVKVSIGAMVDQLVEETEGSDVLLAKGINYQELSTTPTPGVEGVSITRQSNEYQLTESDNAIIKKLWKKKRKNAPPHF